MSVIEVTVDGRNVTAGDHISVNGIPTAADADIENGAVLQHIRLGTFGELLAQEEIPLECALLNGSHAEAGQALSDGDEITMQKAEIPSEAPQEAAPEPLAEPDGIPIVFNGMPAVFPAKAGQQPIFLDILAAFSDDPTGLLAGSENVTINGKLARLDEVIRPGDEIVID